MKFILGKKSEMTQIWQGDKVVAVTKVSTGPCTVVQVKNNDKDAYNAVQIGFETKKEKNIKKPQRGHFKDLANFRYLKEFRVKEDNIELKRGDRFDIESFEKGDKINVSGISKGKGFQGVVKKYGFAGQVKTHGTKDQVRMPGSIGATGPAHVFKGTRMGGRMGGDKTTLKGLEIIDIDKENNLLFVAGALPGAKNSLLLLSADGDLKLVEEEVREAKTEKAVEEKAETHSAGSHSAGSGQAGQEESGEKDEKVEEKKDNK